jgi:hypothetical protein
MSQFDVDEVLVFEAGKDRETQVVRLAEKADMKDLLERYALGSLYMAEEVARQGVAK